MIENLLLAPTDPKFKTTKHKYKLNFMGSTKCRISDAVNIPLYHFEFVPFCEIFAGKDEGFFIGMSFIYLFIIYCDH